MTLKEAHKILGVSKENTDREIKAKYKKLLIMYHPDSDPTRERAPEDDEKIRQVIEAYKKIRESEGEPYFEPYEFTWDAFENKRAFSERNIFFQFKIYDEALPPSKMARGRFVWDPDMEEFPLFAKSVLEACKEVMVDSNRKNRERIHVAIELAISKDLTDTPVSNGKLIKELLR